MNSFIQSKRKIIFLYFGTAYLVASGTGEAHWVGMNDLNNENSYMWSDGTPVTYINWADGGKDRMIRS